MPIDYSKYPANWKTEIRPARMAIAGEVRVDGKVVTQAKCERCNAVNHSLVCRGTWNDKPVWQNDDGQIYNSDTGEYMGDSYVGDVWTDEKRPLVKIVLTIAHVEHDLTKNELEDLRAWCQRCHNHHDKEHRNNNRRETIKKKKGQMELL
jgi:hypothetical protein